MNIPDHCRPTDEDVAELLEHFGAADLISATDEGLLATFLPLIHEPTGSTPETGPGGRCAADPNQSSCDRITTE